MTGNPDHPNPYPPADLSERLARIEGWRGTVDEWRRGIDAWRRTIEREGLLTAVAVMGTKLDRVMQDVDEMKDSLDELRDTDQKRKGIVLTGRAAAAAVGVLAALAAVAGLAVRVAVGG